MASSAYSHVIVGTDGSATASCAVHAAGAVARALEVAITVATGWYRDHVSDWDAVAGAGSPRNAQWAMDTVVDAAAVLRASGCRDVRTATPEGGPADVLLRLAEDRPGALVVVGTVGLDSTADRLLGNIPHQLTHQVRADLLLVHRGECDGDVSWSSVALATDGSDTAARAVTHGLDLAGALGARTALVTVAPTEEHGQRALTRTAVETDEQHVAVSRSTAVTLVEAARGHDLLVLGNKGMSGPSRLLGSIANSVTHNLPTDLLLVNTTR